MAKEPGTPSGAYVNFVAALVKAAPRDLPDEVLLQWVGKDRRLTQVLRAIIIDGPKEKSNPNPPPIQYKEICIKFELVGRHYEARNFPKTGKSRQDINAMLERNGGTTIYQEELDFIRKHSNSVPPEIQQYRLVFLDETSDTWRRVISCFWHNGVFRSLQRAISKGTWMKENSLVLRRLFDEEVASVT